MRSRTGLPAAAVVAMALLGAIMAHPARAQEMSFSQAQLVRGLLPVVVNITARAEVGEPRGPVLASAGAGGKASQSNAIFQIKTSAGSGFIIDPSGDIATNWHVVEGAYEIVVTFSDGTHARARLVNASPLVDLAVIKVDANRKLAAAHWGDSAKVQVGDPVLAIGNPLGVGMSVSGGLVSALNRNIMDTPYDNFIQTDAAINHGNSGGPLFDMQGEVIGVNSALISPTSGNAGLGFAMPSNDARFIIERLMHKHWQRPGYIGVKLQQVTPEMALALGIPEPEGSIVAGVVEGSPADQAGIRNGDVLLRFGTETPADERALLRAIARTPPGTQVPLALRRGGQEIEVSVKVDEWPVMWWENPVTTATAPHLDVPPDLGLMVAPLNEEMRASYGVRPEAAGVIVTGVLPGTDAAQHGLAPGDVIEQVNDTLIRSAADMQSAIEAARKAQRPFALFLVMKKDQPVTPAQLPASAPPWAGPPSDRDRPADERVASSPQRRTYVSGNIPKESPAMKPLYLATALAAGLALSVGAQAQNATKPCQPMQQASRGQVNDQNQAPQLAARGGINDKAAQAQQASRAQVNDQNQAPQLAARGGINDKAAQAQQASRAQVNDQNQAPQLAARGGINEPNAQLAQSGSCQ
jgi:serine protease Do